MKMTSPGAECSGDRDINNNGGLKPREKNKNKERKEKER